MFTAEEFTVDEAQVDKEDEFTDEYAFHNDFLFNGIDEVISLTIQAAHELAKEKARKGKKGPRKKRKREGCDSQGRTAMG